MSILTKLEAEGRAALTAVEHAAAWLVGRVASTEADLSALEASSPLVAEAVSEGVAAAKSLGVPVADIETAGADVLTAAKDLAANLTQTAKPVTPAPAPAAS